MKIKKHLLILFTLVLVINMRAQTFDDLIITKEQDTIQCKITLINDYSIFYDYKKKKNTKSTYISKAEVLEYLSETYKVDENLKFSNIHPSCDTCENWIVLKTDDTLFYDIKLFLAYNEKIHFYRFQIKSKNSSSTYHANKIKSAQWNGKQYFNLTLSNWSDFAPYHSETNAGKWYSFIGYQKYSGRINLVEFSYPILRNQGVYPVFNYCIKDNDEFIYISNNKKKFIELMQTYIVDNPKLLKAIGNREFKYKDLETIVKIYNL